MESVLVGVDRSDGSRRALAFALKRAQVNQWAITIAHVINWSRYSFPIGEDNEVRPVQRRAEVEAARAEIVEPLVSWAEAENLRGDVEITVEIRHGRPSEVLATIADERGHDVIVVGRKGDSDLRVAIFGSTANRLTQHAAVPVVVVP
ncbi:hypothetical protein GCM10023080_049450 [Streptomyces pseudoechinosporeus]